MVEQIMIGDVSLDNFLIFIFITISTVVISNLVGAAIRRLFDTKFSRRNSKMLAKVVQYFITAFGLYYGIYHILGLDLTALAASLGIFGIAVAFGSQQIIQNMIAGVLISLSRPIQVEDWVTVGGLPSTGFSRVKDISLTKTILRDQDGKIIYMPNSQIIDSKVINYTRAGFLEVPILLTVPINQDVKKLEKLRHVVLKVANENKKILPNVTRRERSIITKLFKLPSIENLFTDQSNLNMFQPRVLISELTKDEIKLSIRIWIREVNKKDEIVSEFLEELLKRFKKEKIIYQN